MLGDKPVMLDELGGACRRWIVDSGKIMLVVNQLGLEGLAISIATLTERELQAFDQQLAITTNYYQISGP